MMTLLQAKFHCVIGTGYNIHYIICCCVVCAMRAKDHYWINKGTLSDITQEVIHARLWDDAKQQLKQPILG